MRIIAQIISWVFIPLFMPIYALLLGMYIPSFDATFQQENTLYWMHPVEKYVTLIQFFIFSVMAPGISLVMMFKNKAISSIEVDNRRERNVPIIVTGIYCLLLGFLLHYYIEFKLPVSVYAMPFGGFLAIMLAGLINRKTKISMHANGAGMLFGYICAYYYLQIDYYMEVLVSVIIISGLVLSARVYLRKHTPAQVYYGFLLGSICMAAMVFVFAAVSG